MTRAEEDRLSRLTMSIPQPHCGSCANLIVGCYQCARTGRHAAMERLAGECGALGRFHDPAPEVIHKNYSCMDI